MRAPQFWYKKNWQSILLYPLGCLYAGITALRLKTHQPLKVSVPVICIGNLTAGGSGKTPTAISIAAILKKFGKNPFFVSRGYGGTLSDTIVDINVNSATEVGDEPLLLAKQAPVVINHKRDQAALRAISEGADIIIMDDGFQNPSLHKDKSLLVIDGAVGMGNELPIPAGPMREFFSSGLKRAQGIIILGDDKYNIADRVQDLPIFRGHVSPQKINSTERQVIAFAGIGRPEKFYQSLQDCGLTIIKTISFPDHHFYQKDELENIISAAEQANADIYTTAKDMVKIPYKLQKHFKVLEICIEWEDEKALTDFLLTA